MARWDDMMNSEFDDMDELFSSDPGEGEDAGDWTEPENFWDDFDLPAEEERYDLDELLPEYGEEPTEQRYTADEAEEPEYFEDEPMPEKRRTPERTSVKKAKPAKKANTGKSRAPEKKAPGEKTKKRTGLYILLGVVGVLLLSAALLYRAVAPDAKALLKSKDEVKAEAAVLAEAAKSLDMDGVQSSGERVLSLVREDAAILDKPIWQFAAKMPVVGEDLVNVRRLLTLAESGIQELLFPAADFVKALPTLPEDMDALKEDPVEALGALDVGEWMDTADRGFALADDCLPTAEELLGELADFPQMNIDKLENTMEPIRDYAKLGLELLPVAGDKAIPLLRDDLLPAARKLKEVGSFEDLLPEEGIVNVKMLSQYLDILDEMMPTLRAMPEKLAFMDELDSEKAAELKEKLLTKLDECLAVYDKAEPYLPLLRAFLGEGEDKLYLMAAQNTAEIRACGGFPGSAGYIRVKDGVLFLDDMTTGYSVFAGQNFVTPQEIEFFLEMVAIGRDSVVDPYFPIVASRWAANYSERKNTKVDGCVSFTPAIISDLLYVTGPIELSDGTTVDGENVIRFIGNEIYVKYLQTYNENTALTDELFVEIAETTLHRLFDDITLEKLSQYIDIFAKRSQDRVIMMWLADEAEEELVKQVGCDGGFNTDPTHPQLGVYFTNYFASKLGWYVDLDVDIGDPTRNGDGSMSYPVTVHVAHTLKNEDVSKVGQFVIAQTGGTMGAQLYFSAPAGGYFSDYKGTADFTTIFFNDSEYYGNKFMPTNLFFFPPEEEVTITMTVTTAPGEQEPMTYVTTPTYQNYR